MNGTEIFWIFFWIFFKQLAGEVLSFGVSLKSSHSGPVNGEVLFQSHSKFPKTATKFFDQMENRSKDQVYSCCLVMTQYVSLKLNKEKVNDAKL